VPTDAAALLETYGRALDDAGLEHATATEEGAFVLTISEPGHEGTIVIVPLDEGSHVGLEVRP
jgi:hypothetical protein